MEYFIDPESVFLVKLTNGQTLISNLHESGIHNDIYTLTYPILMSTIYSNHFSSVKQVLIPWIHGSSSQEANISSHDILTVSPASDYMIRLYSQYLFSYLLNTDNEYLSQDKPRFNEIEEKPNDSVEETLSQYLMRQNRFLN